MISFFLRRAKREVCRQLVVELFDYDKSNDCWDPIGSIDAKGLNRTIQLISDGKLPPSRVDTAKKLFKG